MNYIGNSAAYRYEVFRKIPNDLIYSKDFLETGYYEFRELRSYENPSEKYPYFKILTSLLSNEIIAEIIAKSENPNNDLNELLENLQQYPEQAKDMAMNFVNLSLSVKSRLGDKGDSIEINKLLFDDNFLKVLEYRNRNFVTDTLNKFLMTATSDQLEKYIDKIQKDFVFYDNFPVIILNKNLAEEDKINYVKKTFVKKNLLKYVSFLRNNINDLDLLDTFIEATIIENNRIKEKYPAVQEMLARMFIGNRTDSFSISYTELQNAKNYEKFFKKYLPYLTPKFLNSQMEDHRYWSNKNTNIGKIIQVILSFEKTLADKITCASKYAKTDNIISELKQTYMKEHGGALLATDEILNEDIIAFIKYDIERNKSCTLSNFPIKSYYNLTSSGRATYAAAIAKLANRYPSEMKPIFETLDPTQYSEFGFASYWGWDDCNNAYSSDFDALKKTFLINLSDENLKVVIDNFIAPKNAQSCYISPTFREMNVMYEFIKFVRQVNQEKTIFKDIILEHLKKFALEENIDIIFKNYSRLISQISESDFKNQKYNSRRDTPTSLALLTLKEIKGIAEDINDNGSTDTIIINLESLISNIDLFSSLSQAL